MLKNIIVVFFQFLLSVGAVCFGIWIMGVGIDRQARVECLQWSELAEEYRNFYLVEWQKKQCEAVGVEVNAITILYKK